MSVDLLREEIEKAFDYRGDVTLVLADGSTLEGYVFDRHVGSSLEDSYVRVIPKGQRAKVLTPLANIREVNFSGRDMAAGKSWEAWVKKYFERKLAGEANIELTPDDGE